MKESGDPGLSDKVMLPPILHLRESSLFLKEKTLNCEIALFEQNSAETVVFTGWGCITVYNPSTVFGKCLSQCKLQYKYQSRAAFIYYVLIS